MLEQFNRVIFLLDGDPTGRNAGTVIAQRLRPDCNIRVISLPDGVQPDQLRAEDIAKMLPEFTNDD